MSKQILILAGDGIGPEIVKAAEQVLTRVNEKFNLDFSLCCELISKIIRARQRVYRYLEFWYPNRTSF